MQVQNCCFAYSNLLLFFLFSLQPLWSLLDSFGTAMFPKQVVWPTPKAFRFFKSKKAFVKTKKFHLVNENTVQPQCATTSLSDHLP